MSGARGVLIRSDSTTNPKYGIKPEDRSIGEYIHKGFIVLDKPSGPTSHQIADWVKKMLELDKTGHSGTLDPKVTGVLTIALSDSTKILQALFGADKEYVCLMKIHGEVTNNKLKKVLSDFQGVITQTPPVKSAVKRQARKRRINRIIFLERDGDYVLFSVLCEAGTYIRKLCHDIGVELGFGAHMAQLRRTLAGDFSEQEAITLHDLRDAWEEYRNSGDEEKLRELVKPMEEIVRATPKIWVKDSAVDSICNGGSLKNPGISKLNEDIRKHDLVALMSLKDELIALGEANLTSKEMMQEHGEAVKLKRVVMKKGTYPEI